MMAEGKKLLNTELRVVNVGLELFANDLRSLGVPVVQVDWRPPAAVTSVWCRFCRGYRVPSPAGKRHSLCYSTTSDVGLF